MNKNSIGISTGTTISFCLSTSTNLRPCHFLLFRETFRQLKREGGQVVPLVFCAVVLPVCVLTSFESSYYSGPYRHDSHASPQRGVYSRFIIHL
jgi:hypothetical protein